MVWIHGPPLRGSCQVPDLATLHHTGQSLLHPVPVDVIQAFQAVSAPYQLMVEEAMATNGHPKTKAEVKRFVLLSMGLGLTHANAERSVWSPADPMGYNPWLASFMSVRLFREFQRYGKYDVATMLHKLSAGVNEMYILIL